MSNWTRTIPFKVDIAGVIHIMGSALYSRPDAAVRELIQNSHDAVMRRRQHELGYQGRIDIRQDAEQHVLEFSDDGFGLNAEEAEQYLGTLGIGLTGLLKGEHPAATATKGSSTELIGMFGIGLFSGFMLAERMMVESRRIDASEGVRWDAGEGTEIELSSCERDQPGTLIRLYLKPEYHRIAEDTEAMDETVKEYADFLSVPIHLNGSQARANVIHTSWFDPTPDKEAIELELASYFDESPLDVIPVHVSNPTSVSGALYISPQRTPGFADEAVVTATVRGMVISRNIRGLLPNWASFVRGVLEVRGCMPTASREDLVKNREFALVQEAIESHLFDHLETLANEDTPRWEPILAWHRYTFAGAALVEPRLQSLLQRTYKFPTSQGLLTFDDIAAKSDADPIFETDFDQVIWYNTDRRQEAWANSLFANHHAPCVHTLQSFEESLLVAMAGSADRPTDLRFASPSSPGFAQEILGFNDLEEAPSQWSEFLSESDASIQCGSFQADQPVMAFLNERHELMRTFEDLKQRGTVPSGFQRLIDAHFDEHETARNEIVLNRNHRLVARALEQKTSSPLASVLRLLVANALRTAGASLPNSAQRQQTEDLDWIAECLWGKD